MNREVSLTKRVQTSKGLRYCPAVTSKNGRIKPDVVLIDGKEEQHTEGAYYRSLAVAVTGFLDETKLTKKSNSWKYFRAVE